MTTEARKMSPEIGQQYDEAVRAAARLSRALKEHNIVIPSLRGTWPCNGVHMVELGGCRADVAEALAEVLEKAKLG
ncbi:hypothetical protein [Streptomyces sp. NBC_01751]|uniref:hypothetical protein n=1 Tax=Streptomyces sp. NBC_01751 TaxID=2975929 RepID=UPI002DD8A462|nr:hypothetical protein [Streptomyces sp. NBC_01751]WSD23375.1 hypothetical protein OHA26_07725 [Streptomyces sp. NBC_01751]